LDSGKDLVKNPVDAYIHASASCKRCSKGSGVRLGFKEVTKAIDMLGLVRTECGQSLRVRWVTFLQQLSKSAGYGHQRMKGEQVGNEVIVL
jgi:hypothetical protein